jgi:hypothetical protein
MTPYLTSAAISALLIAQPLAAAQDPGPRQHGIHEHGVASLTLAIEGTVMQVELESPAMNLVGFEHAPMSDAERKALDDALAVLADWGRLFRVPEEAGCDLEQAEVETPPGHLDEDGAGRTDREPAKVPGHGHEHGHEQADDHAGAAHADIRAAYRLDCRDPGALTRLDLGLFDAFPGTERVRVQFVTPGGQGAVELTPADSVLRF